MTNPRDTGRYDAITDTWIDQQVRIDFAWGNIPIQPNDDRGDNTLDPALDSHIIATNGWSSFPEFEPNTGFDPQTAIVPNLVGMNNSVAQQALWDLGLQPNAQYTDVGATSQNNETVKDQGIAEGTVVDLGTSVHLSIYHYTAPAINHTIAGIRKDFGGSTNGYGFYWMFLMGQNHNLSNGNTLTISGCDVAAYNGSAWNVISSENDSAFNTGGTKVLIFWNGAITETANGTGGTYTKTS
jgi:hypothetical protein